MSSTSLPSEPLLPLLLVLNVLMPMLLLVVYWEPSVAFQAIIWDRDKLNKLVSFAQPELLLALLPTLLPVTLIIMPVPWEYALFVRLVDQARLLVVQPL